MINKVKRARSCASCGTTFVPRAGRGRPAHFCSHRCRETHRRARPHRIFDRECVVCGVRFTTCVKKTRCCSCECGNRLSQRSRTANAMARLAACMRVMRPRFRHAVAEWQGAARRDARRAILLASLCSRLVQAEAGAARRHVREAFKDAAARWLIAATIVQEWSNRSSIRAIQRF
jgi:hypothetical protein